MIHSLLRATTHEAVEALGRAETINASMYVSREMEMSSLDPIREIRPRLSQQLLRVMTENQVIDWKVYEPRTPENRGDMEQHSAAVVVMSLQDHQRLVENLHSVMKHINDIDGVKEPML